MTPAGQGGQTSCKLCGHQRLEKALAGTVNTQLLQAVQVCQWQQILLSKGFVTCRQDNTQQYAHLLTLTPKELLFSSCRPSCWWCKFDPYCVWKHSKCKGTARWLQRQQVMAGRSGDGMTHNHAQAQLSDSSCNHAPWRCCRQNIQHQNSYSYNKAATASAMHTHHPQLTLSWQSSTSLVSPVCLPSLPQTCAAPAQLCCRSKCRLRMPVPKCVRKLCSTMPIAYGRESPCTPSLPNSSFGSLCRKGAQRGSTVRMCRRAKARKGEAPP